MAGYVYRGTKRGELDPWVPQPKPEPAPKPPKQFQPCGTVAAHKRHISHGEDPCEPCLEAKRNYDRKWRKKRIGPAEKAAKKEADRLRRLRMKEAMA